ncbi:hypothetical protein L1276_000656 [Flavobacterium sp. HSC-32F16]|uniref:hypothetical protein n=1 Tax=Flavobacterium sp. HSC-32F16 TaxID=2910964 RepID=UPI0020A2C63C|nr:hypothetical protein [Flavobacterium sp. HSC-32F16]MCP2025516.1 hypothetical protein [Flavobacterium sp. HSC-32F16]
MNHQVFESNYKKLGFLILNQETVFLMVMFINDFLRDEGESYPKLNEDGFVLLTLTKYNRLIHDNLISNSIVNIATLKQVAIVFKTTLK